MGDAESDKAFERQNRDPRLDFHALSIGANQVVNPQRFVLQHDPATGQLTADIPDSPVDRRIMMASIKLPVTMQLRCGENGWVREDQIDNRSGLLKSTTNVHIDIRKEVSGDLIASGKHEALAEWLPKGKALIQWTARFRDLDRPRNAPNTSR
ncbi:hypothetical protein [Noviherbaspirillum autotrophicum]|nr:hypothetical protein [Noviherbaspirillum autotrophicum]